MFFCCRSRTAIIVLLALMLLPGCGKKTALTPPQQLVPRAITDLRYSLDESGVSLEWTFPEEMESGDELSVIENFELLRAEMPEDDYCEGCPVRFDRKVLIDGGPLPAPGESSTAAYKEAGLREGYRYLYKVRSRAGWWYPSSYSNIVSFSWRSPPGVPGGLQAVPGDRKIILKWEPVNENLAGRPLEQVSMYRIYRKGPGDRFVVLGDPFTGLQFNDTGLSNGVLYEYRVQAIAIYGETRHAGGLSNIIKAVPRDLTPPAQPENLFAVATPDGVKLAWQPVVSDDIGGYKIYRREENSAEAELIAEVRSDLNQYLDRNIVKGRKWFYSVTSFDKALPPNESLRSVESSAGHM